MGNERERYEKPGEICLVEYDPRAKAVAGYPKRIWRGGLTGDASRHPICISGGTGITLCARREEPDTTTVSPWGGQSMYGVPMREIPQIQLLPPIRGLSMSGWTRTI